VESVFKVPSRINSTWGGNLVDMVRCQRYIEIIEDEALLDNARRVGQVLLDGVRGFEAEFPGRVSNGRGLGMLVAFDLPDGETRTAVRLEMRKEARSASGRP
jgi:L-lysine 6-transaminase